MSLNMHRNRQPRPKSNNDILLSLIMGCSVVSVSFLPVLAIPETVKNAPLPSLLSGHEGARNAENTSQLTNQRTVAIKATNERQGLTPDSKQHTHNDTPTNQRALNDTLTNQRADAVTPTTPRADNSVSTRLNSTAQPPTQSLSQNVAASLELDKELGTVTQLTEKRDEEEVVATESPTPQNVLPETQTSSTLKENKPLTLHTVLTSDKATSWWTVTTLPRAKEREQVKTVTTHFPVGVSNSLQNVLTSPAVVQDTGRSDQNLTTSPAVVQNKDRFDQNLTTSPTVVQNKDRSDQDLTTSPVVVQDTDRSDQNLTTSPTVVQNKDRSDQNLTTSPAVVQDTDRSDQNLTTSPAVVQDTGRSDQNLTTSLAVVQDTGRSDQNLTTSPAVVQDTGRSDQDLTSGSDPGSSRTSPTPPVLGTATFAPTASNNGCGDDWLSYSNNCFKPIFVKFNGISPGQSYPTMPLPAEIECNNAYGATLASLQEPGAMEFAKKMIRRSGFWNAVVGIRRVKPMTRSLRHLYRFVWQWGGRGGPMAYDQVALQRGADMNECAILNVKASPFLESIPCIPTESVPQGFICMKPNPTRPREGISLSGITFYKSITKNPRHFPTKVCPDGSLAQTFHRCQWGEEEEEDDGDDSGERPSHNPPLFPCRLGRGVHYSLLCDGKDDCVDGTDEITCQRPQFSPLLSSSFICGNLQTIPSSRRCDGTSDCFDESDEESCVSCGNDVMCPGLGCIPVLYAVFLYFDSCPPFPYGAESPPPSFYPPGKVILDGTGMSKLHPGECGDGFYLCEGGYCIPSFLFNNGERDCPQGEDEGIPVNNMKCPGFYRCQGVGSCVHEEYVCDGVYHCPNKDDEMFCHLTCPRDCRCEGHAYTCSKMIDPLENLHVRYLDLSHGSDVILGSMHVMEFLSLLNVSSCELDNVTLVNMPQLRILDLSFNQLTDITSLILQNLPALEYLDLSNNPFVKILGSTFSSILAQGQLSNLKTLLMTNVGMDAIDNEALSSLSNLKHLDLRQNQLQKYGEGSLSGLSALEELHTDESKLCCGYYHSTVSRCYAPVDELSSCDDLLGKDFFRVFLWALSSLAIVGNVSVLVFRQFSGTKKSASASGVLVKNLCASDLLMGVYMLMIGIADAQLRGDYVAKETEWKSSPACTVAGFLSFLSSEVSAFVLCLITLDRVLVICFPFRSRIHLNPQITWFICYGVWIVGVVLAGVPLLAGLEFYGQNGICVPLPITRQQFSGQSYAFAVFIVLNFVLFILIGVGQVLIYTAVRRASVAAGSQRQERDMVFARRLFTIVLSDFCCWFPIGLIGLLATRGVPIPGVLNVWVAIFVLPLNSALNPFLYTLNGVLEKRRAKKAERTRRRILRRLKTEIPKWQPASVTELVKICVLAKVLDKDALTKLLALHADFAILDSTKDEVSQDNGAGPHCGELTNIVSETATQSTTVNVDDDIQTE